MTTPQKAFLKAASHRFNVVYFSMVSRCAVDILGQILNDKTVDCGKIDKLLNKEYI
jgi:hypothetical protein